MASLNKIQMTVLQIDSILDVGMSFYSQSQKVQGQENDNVHVSADEPTQKPVNTSNKYCP